MSREKKKGKSGNAKAFITRGAAMKKLQLSLGEFRRLCILKGIYPRNPKKKLEGHDKTYYLRKDIDFLAHERLIGTIRHENAHRKKVVKARAKRRLDKLKRLALDAPRSRLDHLVVERYPRFEDALRELDDPLCLIALFANLPAKGRIGVSPHRVTNCQRLFREFCNFVADTGALTNVFVSVKGYYFQASIAGETVTWITPHRFTQIIPVDVDYSVMRTFLELYECILSFVNFRLYTSKNFAYPPVIDRDANNNALELASLLVKRVKKTDKLLSDALEEPSADESKTLSKNAMKEAESIALSAVAEVDEEDEEEEKMDTDQKDGENEPADGGSGNTSGALWGDSAVPHSFKRMCTVFEGKSVVLGREVPYIELEFALTAAGAKLVTREDNLPDGADRLEPYTHWIIDRPKISGARNMSIEYVQPQYVFDSINRRRLLPTKLYGPGTPLPPHLSPFTSGDDDGGYRPWFQEMLDRIDRGDASVVDEAATVVYAEAEAKARREHKASIEAAKSKVVLDEDEPGVEVEDADVEGESEGESDGGESDGGESDAEEDVEGEEERAATEEREKRTTQEKEMATMMLSRKKRRAYDKTKQQERRREEAKEKLLAKRKQIQDEVSNTAEKKSTKKRRVQRLGM